VSLAAISWARRQKTGSATFKAVLMALAGYADEKGLCWPSQAALAEETEMTDRSVRTALGALEDAGFIQREKKYRKDGTRDSDRITLLLPERASGSQAERPSGGLPENDGTYRKELPVDYRKMTAGLPEGASASTTFEPSVNRQKTTLESARAPEPIAEPDHDTLGKSLANAAGKAIANPASSPGLLILSEPLRWLRSGCDLQADVLPAIQARCSRARPGSVRSWAYFADAVFQARDDRLRPAPEPTYDHRPRQHHRTAPGSGLNRADRAAIVTLAAVGLGPGSGFEGPGEPGEAPPPTDRRGAVVDLGPGDFAPAPRRRTEGRS
jgi:hypothetical protein